MPQPPDSATASPIGAVATYSCPKREVSEELAPPSNVLWLDYPYLHFHLGIVRAIILGNSRSFFDATRLVPDCRPAKKEASPKRCLFCRNIVARNMPSLQIERPIEHDIAATRRLFDSDPCAGKLHVCNRRGPVVVGTTRAGRRPLRTTALLAFDATKNR